MAYLGWGTSFIDFDNDGWLDLFIANGHVYPEIDDFDFESKYHEPRQVYRNLGKGRFKELTGEIGGPLLDKKSGRGAAFADYDNDGDIDVLVVNMNEPPSLLRNDTASDNAWVSLRLHGTKSNRDGIGARVSLTAGGLQQTREIRSGGSYLSHNDFRMHFGLGQAKEIVDVEVSWPSGLIETFPELSAGRYHALEEGQGDVRE